MSLEADPKVVGSRIRDIRTRLGLSMAAFAEKIDQYENVKKTKSGTVSNWETGKNLPNNNRLVRIAELGGVTVDELLYGEIYDKEYVYVYGIIKGLYLDLIRDYMPESDDDYERFIHEVTKIYLKDNKEPFSHSANNIDIKIFTSIYKALENEGFNININSKTIADLYITQLEITNAKTFKEIKKMTSYIYGSDTAEERSISKESKTIYAEISYTLDDLKDLFKIVDRHRRSPIVAMPEYTYKRMKSNENKSSNEKEEN